MAGLSYPFEPKSNRHLRPGQFWGVPMRDGRWACGRVLAVKVEPDEYFAGNSRMFLAALMDWHGDQPPTEDDLTARTIMDQGWAHVRTIRQTGGQVLGERDLSLDGIRGLRNVSHRLGGTVMLYEGAEQLRPATSEEASALPVLSTWGLQFITRLAEKFFIDRLSIDQPEA